MRIDDLIILEAKKKPKEKKVIYVENGQDLEPFPDLCISGLEKEIKKAAKDLTQPVSNPIQLVNSVFQDNSVPQPQPYQSKRWSQYLDLLKVSVAALGAARGFRASWSTT